MYPRFSHHIPIILLIAAFFNAAACAPTKGLKGSGGTFEEIRTRPIGDCVESIEDPDNADDQRTFQLLQTCVVRAEQWKAHAQNNDEQIRKLERRNKMWMIFTIIGGSLNAILGLNELRKATNVF